jgi:DDE_Tnp_1-associated/DDE superfamily endonuclease
MQRTHPQLSLIEHFKNLPDPRVNRTRDHELIDVLTIAICTLLCAGESFNDMEDFGRAKEDWFKTFLTLKNGILSHDTFNYATHKHARVEAWLKKHPRFSVHYTPTSASWLNMVERFFRDLTVRRVRAGVFRSVAELEGVQELCSLWPRSHGQD